MVVRMVISAGIQGTHDILVPHSQGYMIYWDDHQLEQLADANWNEEFWAPAPYYTWRLTRCQHDEEPYRQEFNLGYSQQRQNLAAELIRIGKKK